MLEDSKLKAHGALEMVIRRENGDVEVVRKDNIIVSVGFDFICDAIGNSSRPSAMGYIAVGTGTNPAASADTALQTELNRQTATYAHTAGTQTMTFTATFAAGVATGAITEAGVFNAASAGKMLDHVVFPVINKGANDTLTATFTFTLS